MRMVQAHTEIIRETGNLMLLLWKAQNSYMKGARKVTSGSQGNSTVGKKEGILQRGTCGLTQPTKTALVSGSQIEVYLLLKVKEMFPKILGVGILRIQ